MFFFHLSFVFRRSKIYDFILEQRGIDQFKLTNHSWVDYWPRHSSEPVLWWRCWRTDATCPRLDSLLPTNVRPRGVLLTLCESADLSTSCVALNFSIGRRCFCNKENVLCNKKNKKTNYLRNYKLFFFNLWMDLILWNFFCTLKFFWYIACKRSQRHTIEAGLEPETARYRVTRFAYWAIKLLLITIYCQKYLE